jgi:hypothetical protein
MMAIRTARDLIGSGTPPVRALRGAGFLARTGRAGFVVVFRIAFLRKPVS